MLPLDARKLVIVEGVLDDDRMRARVERMRPFVKADCVQEVDDEALAEVVRTDLADTPRHGMAGDPKPVVIFNRFRFDDDNATRAERIKAYPELNQVKFNGYGGFEWRDSGSPTYRRNTGLVCQPAYQLHTIVGCHFRCAYCSFGHFLNVMMNMEEFVGRLDDEIARCPEQTLFQYDNWTDTVCFEPEYGGAKLLADYFADKEGKALELYVGKSDHVSYLTEYDHRGHTVCCWSLAGPTQTELFERRAATMEGRIESMRICQEAGYPVRVRFSPIIPVRNWREENREMIEKLFAAVDPDVITIETIRFLDYDAMSRDFDLSMLDPEMVAALRDARGKPFAPGCELPDPARQEVYRFIFDELARVSPDTRVAFCREKRSMWDTFAADLARHGQGPDHYFCNCGPFSHPATADAV